MTDTTEDKIEHAEESVKISLKTITTIVTGAITILGGIWALDSHYASAADVTQLQRSMESQITQIRADRIEDELFKLDAKKQAQNGKLDPIDSAIYERYLRRLQAIQQEARTSKVSK